jgi:hypothetical protein
MGLKNTIEAALPRLHNWVQRTHEEDFLVGVLKIGSIKIQSGSHTFVLTDLSTESQPERKAESVSKLTTMAPPFAIQGC